MVEYQLNSGNYSITSEEVLKSHIKNWKNLSFKQKQVVLNFINARRSKEAKTEFLKELSLLGQKIAHDDLQRQTQRNNN
jgi:large subunit ribosomal protein L47